MIIPRPASGDTPRPNTHSYTPDSGPWRRGHAAVVKGCGERGSPLRHTPSTTRVQIVRMTGKQSVSALRSPSVSDNPSGDRGPQEGCWSAQLAQQSVTFRLFAPWGGGPARGRAPRRRHATGRPPIRACGDGGSPPRARPVKNGDPPRTTRETEQSRISMRAGGCTHDVDAVRRPAGERRFPDDAAPDTAAGRGRAAACQERAAALRLRALQPARRTADAAPRYLFRGSAMGPPAFGSGMTSPPLLFMIRGVVSPGLKASTDR